MVMSACIHDALFYHCSVIWKALAARCSAISIWLDSSLMLRKAWLIPWFSVSSCFFRESSSIIIESNWLSVATPQQKLKPDVTNDSEMALCLLDAIFSRHLVRCRGDDVSSIHFMEYVSGIVAS